MYQNSFEDSVATISEEIRTVKGCVIMASGMGTRFGGNKLMADFNGKPMIMRMIEATDGYFEKRVVVTRHKEIAELCRGIGLSFVLHNQPNRNDTVRLGLEAIGKADSCMFCPGDQPLISRKTISALISLWEDNRDKIIRPICSGTPGSPVIFPSRTFAELMTLPEGKGGSWIIRKYRDQLVFKDIDNPFELMDADTPEALEILRQH